MSEHSHIDKIFKEGLGEKKFSNADAMWQRMEADLDKEGGRKRRPFIFFFASAAFIAAGFFAVQQFNNPAEVDPAAKQLVDANTIKYTNKTSAVIALQPDQNMPVQGKTYPAAGYSNSNALTAVPGNNAKALRLKRQAVLQIPAIYLAGKAPDTDVTDYVYSDDPSVNYLKRVTANVELISIPSIGFHRIAISPAPQNKPVKSAFKIAEKRKMPAASKYTIEAVGGVDLIRLNRKAGYYAGVRVNKKLENGSSFSVGVNYASHIISDRYRVRTKPAEQRSSDARINNISSVRVPVYLQRQMGTSKFSMMVGLVPTYITHAEVYNVPNSYIGDPDPYRKFGLNDINRINLLFGAGLKYAPTNWMALELSGSYGLTGMVKDGYKNLSRVNDNFKSIQLGAAFRLK